MPSTVIIAVSDGFGGYGDFLFALKLAEQIKKYYAGLLGQDNAPHVTLVTQYTGQRKIKNLRGDVEFGVEILTPYELREKIDDQELEVASIIEGPVFCSSLMQQINSAMQTQVKPAPLVMIPEYSRNTFQRLLIDHQRTFRKKGLSKIIYQETIYTGFSSMSNEKGIILSDNLINLAEPSVLASQLEEKINRALLGGTPIEIYRDTRDMYFQYSHDTFSTIPAASAAERFLKIHRIDAKDSKKNQDVLMVGRSWRTKYQALNKIKTQLIKDGFTKISFYNVDTEYEEYLHGEPDSRGRHYRIVYSSGMPHTSIIAAMGLSGDLLGATGDQSFGEAISGDKILIYECLSHKRLLRNEYYDKLKKLDPTCTEILDLLSNAESDSDYESIELLLTSAMKLKLKNLSKLFRESGELIRFAAYTAMPPEILDQQIISGAVFPYTTDSDATAPFERALKWGNFDAVSYVLKNHTATLSDRRTFCEILTKKNYEGISLLRALRRISPDSQQTHRASYLVIRFNLDKYQAPPNSKREMMFHAFKELISTFSALSQEHYDENALIGLILLTTQNIAKEYSFLSPRKGFFFGSRFYSNLEDTLKELGINLKSITPQERQGYYSALSRVMENNPNLIANEYILNSLSEEAHITLPKIPPRLSSNKAKELLQTKNLDEEDPTILRTRTGLYKTHSLPLGQGGWGSVYAARHYSDEEQMNISNPLAIKIMGSRGQKALTKEKQMFEAVYPEGHFEQFNAHGQACLAMPLFPGIPLDDYLNDYQELSGETRKEMAFSLLENLQKIHDAHITHNDLKPKNILYDPVLKKMHIVDFGCAERVGTPLRYRGFDSAVFAFEIPPEYINGDHASPAMDIFSLTPILAEILGANKKEFVRARMERVLSKIDNPHLIKTMVQAFNESATLEIALFSKKMYPLTQTQDFESFVRYYVNESYDFSPYRDILGDETIDLLHRMQHKTPKERPSLQEALDILRAKGAEKSMELTL